MDFYKMLVITISCFGYYNAEKTASCEEDSYCKEENQKPITLRNRDLGEEYKTLEAGELPILLWWYDDVFPHHPKGKSHKINCMLGSCLTSANRELKDNSRTRAFLFYGSSFLANDLPLPRKKYHQWGLFHEESPKNNWIFSHQKGIEIFNHTATFRRESHYPLSSQFIVDVHDWGNKKFMYSTEEKNRFQRTENLAPVVYVQRDCNPPSDRDAYIEELMKYIVIDSYGPCLNNKKMPSTFEGFHMLHDEKFYTFLAKYKFHLSFENAICQDYMTEKLFRPLEIGVVPVYRGSPNVSDFMPTKKSVIIADTFSSPKELAEFLTMLNGNDVEYEKYLSHTKTGLSNAYLHGHLKERRWKIKGQWDKVNFGHRMYAGWECDVCNELLNWDRLIKKHLKDPMLPLPTPRHGQHNHMGCPEPVSFSGYKNRSLNYWEGFHEAAALNNMLASNETDSSLFISKYLRLRTDKYSY